MSLAITILLIFIMTLSGTLGALSFKTAMTRTERRGLLRLIAEPRMYLGGLCYFLGAVLNIVLLQHMPYSVLYPMTSLTYVWTLVLSRFILKESINRNKIIAVILIVAGVVVLNL